MKLQSCVMAIGLFILLVVTGAGGNMAAAQEGNENKGTTAAPPMSLVPDSQHGLDSRVVDLHLEKFEKVIEFSQDIKGLLCAADVCDGKDKSKEPAACLGKNFLKHSSVEDLKKISSLICSIIKSPSAATRRAFLNFRTEMDENDLVQSGAYLMAYKGSAASCENYIKDYVGAYGPQWNYKWYKAMSGCRILAKNRSREEEEKDFSAWLGGNCSKIINTEMRKACNSPGTSFPIRLQAHPSVNAQ